MARDPYVSSLKPVVDEQTKAAQQSISNDQALLTRVETQIAKLQKKVDDAPLDLNKPVNKMTPEELKAYQKARVDAQRVEREDIQSGNNPDNPKPTEDPGPGMYWANYGGVWRKYQYVTNPAGGKGGGGGGGGGSNTTTTTSTSKVEVSDATRDAFAAMQDLFASYGLESLAGEITGYMTQGLTAAEALIKLKTNPTGAYAKRFAGNAARIKNGLNAISEAAYLGLESSYAETLKAYGLGNMVSLNRDDNYKKFADYIAGDVSADEFKDRVDTVVKRVQNSDPSIKATLKSFYPEITDNDLVSYFLSPKENLPKLQEKVTASEIGAAATGAGLRTNVTTATDLARYGIDQEEAREGYSTIAGILPTATKLGDIYNETGVKYAQAEGEAEVFKGNQDAATKRKRLASMERAAFSGSSGTGQSSLTRNTQGLL
jgi:hypothetical protein